MSTERSAANENFAKMKQFAQSGFEDGVMSVCLKGPEGFANFQIFVGVFPDLDPEQGHYDVIADDGIEITPALYFETKRKILGLTIPNQLITAHTEEADNLREALEREQALAGMPSIVLGIGQSEENGDEVVRLFVPAGLLLDRSLAYIQYLTTASGNRLN